MNSSDLLSFSSRRQTLSLACWLGNPLPRKQAQNSLLQIREQLCRPSADSVRRFRLQLVELIVGFWSGLDVQARHANLLAVARQQCDQAMLELCYGQLLLAVRHESAWPHLDRGFRLATHLLDPEDYFLVMKRHERLRVLPCSKRPSAGSGLDELLSEAGVIRRLKGSGTCGLAASPTHRDTVG